MLAQPALDWAEPGGQPVRAQDPGETTWRVTRQPAGSAAARAQVAAAEAAAARSAVPELALAGTPHFALHLANNSSRGASPTPRAPSPGLLRPRRTEGLAVLADPLKFVKPRAGDEADPLATARSRRGEASDNNSYAQHEQLTARERAPLKGLATYESEAARAEGNEEICTPRGTVIRGGSVKASPSHGRN